MTLLLHLGLFFFAAHILQPPERPSLPSLVVGSAGSYTVKPGDLLTSIGARLGIPRLTIARSNDLPADARLRIGQVLNLDNRHIAPTVREDGILINVPQRLLFYFEMGNLVSWYPVGLGAADWRTPLGTLHVLTKETDPFWDVPVSIQREMRRRGEKVRTRVPPGPDNPLGRYWMGLTPGSCGIHATNAPTSVYQFRTHGCIRLHPEDAEDLFSRVTIGTPVEIVYEPVLLARTEEGKIFLEVHPDVYRRAPDPRRAVRVLAERQGLEAELDWALVEERIRERGGIAGEVSRKEPD